MVQSVILAIVSVYWQKQRLRVVLDAQRLHGGFLIATGPTVFLVLDRSGASVGLHMMDNAGFMCLARSEKRWSGLAELGRVFLSDISLRQIYSEISYSSRVWNLSNCLVGTCQSRTARRVGPTDGAKIRFQQCHTGHCRPCGPMQSRFSGAKWNARLWRTLRTGKRYSLLAWHIQSIFGSGR